MKKIRIGITGTGSVIGQAIIKSILHSRLSDKIDMIGFDYFIGTAGSCWVKKNFLLPDCLKKEINIETWVEKIIDCINLENIQFILIGLDFELKLFSKYKNIIESETNCRVLVSDLRVIEISDDKYLTHNFLKHNKLYYPKTLFPEELSYEGIDFPCILKPRFGWGSRNFFVANNMEELKEKSFQVTQPIIQELIGDASCEYTCGVIYLDNSLREIIALKRELKHGNTVTASFSKDTPRIIYDYITEVTNKLKPSGACNFQLRLDNKGIPKVFEINARHSGTTYIRSLFGFKEVEYILSYLLGFKVNKFNLREGVVKRYYEEMFIGSSSN